MSGIIYLLWVITLFIIVSPALALDFHLTSYPDQIFEPDELSAGFTISCSGCGDSYLRAVFFPSGTNYFGYTQNQIGDWVNDSSDKTKFFLLPSSQLESGTYSGVLKAKIDPADSAYIGSSTYNFKIIRYTPSGTKSGETDSVSVSVISASTPTPIPTSTPIPTNTPPRPSSTRTPTSIPTLTKSPTKIPTTTPTPIPTSVSSPKLVISDTPYLPSPTFTEFFTEVLATESAVESVNNLIGSKTNPLGLVIAGLGFVVTGFGGFLLWSSKGKIFR